LSITGKKYKNIKEKFATLTIEKEDKNKELLELINGFNIVKMEKLQFEQELQNMKTHNQILSNEIKSINETLNKKIETTETDSKNIEKLYNELLQKEALNEVKFKNEEQKSKIFEEKNLLLNEDNNTLKREILDHQTKERFFNDSITSLNDLVNDKTKIISDLLQTNKEKDEKIETMKLNVEIKQEVEKLKNENQ